MWKSIILTRFLIYEVLLQHLQVITLKLIGHYIENNVKFDGEISNKIITHFLKQHYDLTIVLHLKAIQFVLEVFLKKK